MCIGIGPYISPDIADLYAEKPGYKSVTHPIGPRPSLHQMPSYESPSPSPNTPTPLPAPPTQPKKPSSFMPQHSVPNKPVQARAFLWLQSRMVEWKWVARYLGIKEQEVVRIERENPSSIAEQCYQMLTTWQRQNTDADTNYVALYKAIQEGERNVDLCKEFAEFVNIELETNK